MINQFLILLFSFLLALFPINGCEDDPVSTSDSNLLNDIEKEVYHLINLHRARIGLTPLEWNDIIAGECRAHSIDMANSKTINHVGFYERVNRIKAKISWSWAGENVAYNYSAKDAVIAWLNSSGHKSNIESNSNLTGVGVAFDEDSVIYFTQIFIKSNN